MPSWTKYVAKFLTALVGVAAVAISQGLLTGNVAKWVAVIITVGAAIGVWAVPNVPQPSAAPAESPAAPVPPPPAPVPPK